MNEKAVIHSHLTQSIWDAAYLITIGFDLMGVEPDLSQPHIVNFRLVSLNLDPDKELAKYTTGKALVEPRHHQRAYLKLRALIEPHRRIRNISKEIRNDREAKELDTPSSGRG